MGPEIEVKFQFVLQSGKLEASGFNFNSCIRFFVCECYGFVFFCTLDYLRVGGALVGTTLIFLML